MAYDTKHPDTWTLEEFMSCVADAGIKSGTSNYNKIKNAMVDNSLSAADVTGTAKSMGGLLDIHWKIAQKLKTKMDAIRINFGVNPTSNPSSSSSSSTTTTTSSYTNTSFTVFLDGQEGKRVTLRTKFTKIDTITKVIQCYKDQEGLNFQSNFDKIVLISAGTTLDHDKTLGSYNIVDDHNLITVLFKARGGAQAARNEERVIRFGKYGLKKTSLPDVLLCYTDDDGVDRALLDCGKHAMAADTMYMFVANAISSKPKLKNIQCPGNGCGVELDWQKCTQIADMNREEYFKWTEKLKQRQMRNTKKCPNCRAYCIRDDGVAIFRMNCIKCKGGDWCWECAQPWKGSGLSKCGNQNCYVIQRANNMLANAKMVTVDHLNIQMPEFRACPRCLTYMYYTNACKHMICNGCAKDFCFVCLGLKGSDGKWPCGSYTDMCPLAPKQKF